MSIFNDAGNLITKKPESDKVIPDKVKPEKEVFCCQYCDEEWDKKRSKSQHERWCSNNPNQRKYRTTKSVKKTKVRKAQITPKTKISKEIDIIKELRDFDKIFGLTDEQIVKYMRKKIEDIK